MADAGQIAQQAAQQRQQLAGQVQTAMSGIKRQEAVLSRAAIPKVSMSEAGRRAEARPKGIKVSTPEVEQAAGQIARIKQASATAREKVTTQAGEISTQITKSERAQTDILPYTGADDTVDLVAAIKGNIPSETLTTLGFSSEDIGKATTMATAQTAIAQSVPGAVTSQGIDIGTALDKGVKEETLVAAGVAPDTITSFRTSNVQVPGGGWVDKTWYESLQKDHPDWATKLDELGVDKFNEWAAQPVVTTGTQAVTQPALIPTGSQVGATLSAAAVAQHQNDMAAAQAANPGSMWIPTASGTILVDSSKWGALTPSEQESVKQGKQSSKLPLIGVDLGNVTGMTSQGLAQMQTDMAAHAAVLAQQGIIATPQGQLFIPSPQGTVQVEDPAKFWALTPAQRTELMETGKVAPTITIRDRSGAEVTIKQLEYNGMTTGAVLNQLGWDRPEINRYTAYYLDKEFPILVNKENGEIEPPDTHGERMGWGTHKERRVGGVWTPTWSKKFVPAGDTKEERAANRRNYEAYRAVYEGAIKDASNSFLDEYAGSNIGTRTAVALGEGLNSTFVSFVPAWKAAHPGVDLKEVTGMEWVETGIMAATIAAPYVGRAAMPFVRPFMAPIARGIGTVGRGEAAALGASRVGRAAGAVGRITVPATEITLKQVAMSPIVLGRAVGRQLTMPIEKTKIAQGMRAERNKLGRGPVGQEIRQVAGFRPLGASVDVGKLGVTEGRGVLSAGERGIGRLFGRTTVEAKTAEARAAEARAVLEEGRRTGSILARGKAGQLYPAEKLPPASAEERIASMAEEAAGTPAVGGEGVTELIGPGDELFTRPIISGYTHPITTGGSRIGPSIGETLSSPVHAYRGVRGILTTPVSKIYGPSGRVISRLTGRAITRVGDIETPFSKRVPQDPGAPGLVTDFGVVEPEVEALQTISSSQLLPTGEMYNPITGWSRIGSGWQKTESGLLVESPSGSAVPQLFEPYTVREVFGRGISRAGSSIGDITGRIGNINMPFGRWGTSPGEVSLVQPTTAERLAITGEASAEPAVYLPSEYSGARAGADTLKGAWESWKAPTLEVQARATGGGIAEASDVAESAWRASDPEEIMYQILSKPSSYEPKFNARWAARQTGEPELSFIRQTYKPYTIRDIFGRGWQALKSEQGLGGIGKYGGFEVRYEGPVAEMQPGGLEAAGRYGIRGGREIAGIPSYADYASSRGGGGSVGGGVDPLEQMFTAPVSRSGSIEGSVQLSEATRLYTPYTEEGGLAMPTGEPIFDVTGATLQYEAGLPLSPALPQRGILLRTASPSVDLGLLTQRETPKVVPMTPGTITRGTELADLQAEWQDVSMMQRQPWDQGTQDQLIAHIAQYKARNQAAPAPGERTKYSIRLEPEWTPQPLPSEATEIDTATGISTMTDVADTTGEVPPEEPVMEEPPPEDVTPSGDDRIPIPPIIPMPPPSFGASIGGGGGGGGKPPSRELRTRYALRPGLVVVMPEFKADVREMFGKPTPKRVVGRGKTTRFRRVTEQRPEFSLV